MAFQIAIDVGGTFTDGVLLDDRTDTIWVAKSLTTPSAPDEGIVRVVEMLLAQKPEDAEGGAAIARVVHGTTLITNTLIERKGTKTALIVTRGTKDALDIRREMRYDTYDLASSYPEPLVPSELRFEVDERIGPDGAVWDPLPRKSIEALGRKIAKSDIAAIAICFLHACVDGKHERETASILRKLAPKCSIAISSEVANEVGEFERMSTVTANAYVQPIVERYLGALSGRLKKAGAGERLDIMVSNGGFTKAELAARTPIHLLESGPAGGVLSAINCASLEGVERALAFDMGGTTAKSCVTVGGTPEITHTFEFARVQRFKKGSGHPAVSPSIDLIEIGAGGGSIARLSPLGLLQVGPESAGSEPGPACYGLGGEDPTVTDADLVLGYLDPDDFLGGKMKLDEAKARHALAKLGKKLGLSDEETARGIHEIVSENMAAAARTHIAEKGFDARTFTFVATGGAGPVHAIDVARRLRISKILCPIASGVGSCLGFLAAPARSDRSWSRIEIVDDLNFKQLVLRLGEARIAIAGDLQQAKVALKDIEWRTAAEMRYLGQGASVEVNFGNDTPESLTAERLKTAFEASYKKLYGSLVPSGIPEVVTWRLAGQSNRTQRRYAFPEKPGVPASAKPAGERKIYLPAEKRKTVVPVYDRYTLAPGAQFAGPAVIREPESTLVIGHKARIQVLESGTVQVKLENVG
ncbi:MAG TPA: hydantoinase/oxoprolinase family protein [Xanthobacteraceae bacterium]|nr:hydantoinase/oxoprolinase family protein [Xanthobacteraceae bacterium]